MSSPLLPETQPAWARFPPIGITGSAELGYGEGGYGEDGYDSPAVIASDVPTPVWTVEILQ
jgi:hypothetical protein